MEPDTPWWRLPDDPLPDSWRDVVEVIRDHESGKQPVYAALYYFLQHVRHARLWRMYYVALLATCAALLWTTLALIWALFMVEEFTMNWQAIALLTALYAVMTLVDFLFARASRQLKIWTDRYVNEVQRLLHEERRALTETQPTTEDNHG